MDIATSRQLDLLYRRHHGEIASYVHRRCRDHHLSHDVTAAAFAAAARLFAEGRGDAVSAAWLVTVAKRRLIDHWRSLRRDTNRFDLLVDEFDRRRIGGDDPVDTTTDLDVRSALAALDPRHREALTLRYVGALSVADVASRLELSYPATESLLARARRSFRAQYDCDHAPAPSLVGDSS